MDSHMAISNTLYEYGVSSISSLQSMFPDSESFFIGVSKVGDPKYVFTIYFPLLFSLHWALGAKLLGTVVVVEWANQVLKWIMKGERPYWWIHEAELMNTSYSLPDLVQTSATCETGPGTPSGHSMAMSAVWYVLVHSAIERLVRPSQQLSDVQKRVVTHFLWTAYAVFQALIIMSRMYIAAHFPHQCFLGLFLGITVAKTVYGSSQWLRLSRRNWVAVAFLILGSATATYWLLLLSGSDPSWSIRRAVKWCVKQEYIHVDTTPFYSLVRYSGAGLGLGLGLTSKYFYRTDRSRFGSGMVIGMALVGLFMGKLAEYVHVIIPKQNEAVFYTSEFALNTALPYGVIALLPYAIMKSSSKRKVHAKHS